MVTHIHIVVFRISLQNRSTLLALTAQYNIMIADNIYHRIDNDFFQDWGCNPSLNYYITHCKWLPTTVFYGQTLE